MEEMKRDRTKEIERQKEYRWMCRRKDSRVGEFLYKNGYPFYGRTYKRYEKDRQRMLKRRCKRLQRVRGMVQWKFWPIYMYFRPHYNKLLFNLTGCKDQQMAIIKLFLVINYYIRFGDVYLYNPIKSTGYRYYSGESVVIYVIPEDMTAVQKTRMKKAIEQEKVKEWNIKNKVIFLMNKEWNITSEWEVNNLYDYNPYTKEKVDIATSFFILYYGYELFKKNFVSKCKRFEIPIFGINPTPEIPSN